VRGPATGSGKQCKPPTPRVLMLFVFSTRQMTSPVVKCFGPGLRGPQELEAPVH